MSRRDIVAALIEATRKLRALQAGYRTNGGTMSEILLAGHEVDHLLAMLDQAEGER